MSSKQEELQWVYGFHAVEAIVGRYPKRVREVLLQRSRDDQRLRTLADAAAGAGISVQQVEKSDLDQRIDGNHQGVLAQCLPAQARSEHELDSYLDTLEKPPLLLILDGVTDPHNLGACLRSAEAAGADAVIFPKDKSAGLTPAARKVACGAAELLPIFKVTNLARCLRQLKQRGIWLTGLSGDSASTVYQLDFCAPTGLVLGAEGKGMRQLSRRECDQLASIPMPGVVESLNVSVAAGVCLFEASRQRLHASPH